MSVFRPSLAPLTPVNDNQDSDAPATTSLLRKRNPMSFGTSPTSSPTGSVATNPDLDRQNSGSSAERLLQKARPRSRQTVRPSSIFGSLRSLHSLQDEDESLARSASAPLSAHSTNSGSNHFPLPAAVDAIEGTILHHGEIQSTGGMFKKRNQYLVLTDTHLVRFKSQCKASEAFPSIPASIGKSNSIRHSRMSSSGSLHELHSPAEVYSAVRLNHVVAVHRLDDGRPYFSIEVAHMDEETNSASAMVLQLNDPREADLWLSCIRAAVQKARLVDPLPFSQYIVEYTARALEQERDYDPTRFHMFTVVQRAAKSGGRSSSDDLAKLSSNISILAVGVYKIHVIPLPKPTRNASSTSLTDMTGTSHGIMTLTSLTVQSSEDKFELNFRVPLRQLAVLCLASSCVNDIALWIRQAADYLRPEWLEQPFTWNVPRSLDDELLPVSSRGDDTACFDRTLTAYCAAYGIDTSNICYTIDYECEDAPEFQLLQPADQRPKYSLLELLSVMRALRYNETFTSISFAHNNLDVLHGQSDEQGWDHVPWTTRSGDPVSIPEHEKSWLLVQEVQALALKSRRLRRLDFSFCLSRKHQGESFRDKGCGICEALFPLCAKQLTNVDWVILNGILLVDGDIDYLYAAAIEKASHFRALELGGCGLMDHSMRTILQAISHQGATMESIDLSGNVARIDPETLQEHMRQFGYIRRINLSNIIRTSAPEPLIGADVLLAWKLVDINLSRTSLNEQSLAALSIYLKSSQSDTLRSFHLDQCQLSGASLAFLLRAMNRGPNNVRDLHLFVSENRLEQHHDEFVHVLSRSYTPSHMTMQMLEYSNEHHFGDLMDGLSKNKTLKYLDISKASLPKDASESTSEALRKMFTQNTTLEILDLSGEEAHLEIANFGIGLNHALTGLKMNEALRVLRIEHQKLGLQGASTLASVLEVNRGLREIHCEKNDINLQAFTVLVNSLERNTSLLYLPIMDSDRASSLKRIDRELDSLRSSSAAVSTKATVKKTLGAAIAGQRSLSSRIYDKSRPAGRSSRSHPPVYAYSSDKDAKAAVGSLSYQWERENARLQEYLTRNFHLAHGTQPPQQELETADPLTTALEEASLGDVTPRAEAKARLGHQAEGSQVNDAGPSANVVRGTKGSANLEEGDDIEGALMMSRSLPAR